MTTEAEYRANQEVLAKLTEMTLLVTSSVPIPTAEELDLTRLGHLHPDDIVDPGNPEMPPVDVQTEYRRSAHENANAGPAPQLGGGTHRPAGAQMPRASASPRPPAATPSPAAARQD
jgi:hypothetical protein